jgi:hypothetical protein
MTRFEIWHDTSRQRKKIVCVSKRVPWVCGGRWSPQQVFKIAAFFPLHNKIFREEKETFLAGTSTALYY